MTAAVLVAVLTAAGCWLLMQRNLQRIVIGVAVLGHAGTVLLLAAGGIRRRGVPLAGAENAGDPLPQAFALTAVVITFGVTVFLLARVWEMAHREHSDDLAPGRGPEPSSAPTDRRDADASDGPLTRAGSADGRGGAR